jgi:hypothetical protein
MVHTLSTDFILQELYGRLWHTTHPDHFQRILERGAIVSEPDISGSKRWKTAQGPAYYPYVRTIGGVSLFDFNGFDPDRYSEKYPLSNWREFVPFRKEWHCAVRIEINRARAAEHFISGVDLIRRWKEEAAYHHSIMPYIEAAYIGDLNRTTFARAFIVRAGEHLCRSLPLE